MEGACAVVVPLHANTNVGWIRAFLHVFWTIVASRVLAELQLVIFL